MNREGFHRRKTNALNIYSTTAPKYGHRYRPLPLTLKKSFILSLCCFFAIVLIFGTPLFSPVRGQNGNFRGNNNLLESSQKQHQCWLKHAMKSGEFKLFSHRSYHDNTQSEQPTCHDALSNLKAIGVNHLDLDLVLNENKGLIVVAHPMEYKRQSKYYSPCANTEFDEMIQTLKSVYGNNDFFVSMEPKAAWGNTQQELEDVALVGLPSAILEILLEKIEEHELQGNCAAIVEIRQEAHNEQELQKERSLLKGILQYCQLFRGIRLLDEPPMTMGDYDMIMPTIEFHPSHPRNDAGKVIPQSLWNKSIFWVVDNEADLALAASLRPFGVVSNSPKNVVDIVEGSTWCDQ